MNDREKLDYIIRLLHELVPNPGYKQGADGLWRNIVTGESQYDELQREAKKYWTGENP